MKHSRKAHSIISYIAIYERVSQMTEKMSTHLINSSCSTDFLSSVFRRRGWAGNQEATMTSNVGRGGLLYQLPISTEGLDMPVQVLSMERHDKVTIARKCSLDKEFSANNSQRVEP